MAIVSAPLLLAGCQQLDMDLSRLSFNDEEEPVTPTRLIPVWTDTVLTRANHPGVRGFGGRIVFYRDGEQRPVKVDGSIVVYAWNDTDADADSAGSEIPDRKYVITADQLASHYSESRVGPSYSVWIPWEEVGGTHRKITLITRFIGTNGAELVSHPVNAVLPGPVDDRIIVEKTYSTPKVVHSVSDASAIPQALHALNGSEGTIQQAAWRSDDVSGASPQQPDEPRMTTTTLPVPPAFAARHFEDNSAPLFAGLPSAHQVHSFGAPQPTDGAAPPRDLSDADRGALAAEAEGSPARAPAVHYAPTPRPAQTRPAGPPSHGLVRREPRRAASPFDRSLQPRWEPPAPDPAPGTAATEATGWGTPPQTP
jgi:hypothetical protein